MTGTTFSSGIALFQSTSRIVFGVYRVGPLNTVNTRSLLFEYGLLLSKLFLQRAQENRASPEAGLFAGTLDVEDEDPEEGGLGNVGPSLSLNPLDETLIEAI